MKVKNIVAVILAIVLGAVGMFMLVVASPSILERVGNTRDKMEEVIDGEDSEDSEDLYVLEEPKPHVFYDTTPPSFIAAVNNGILVIRGEDDLSGVRSYIINGFEFSDIKDGWLDIRLQQFDGGYKNFTIVAVDNVGNESLEYIVENPYYVDPASGSNDNPAENLPISAEPTAPSTAQAAVVDHMSVVLETNSNTPRYATFTNTTVPSAVTDSMENTNETTGESETTREESIEASTNRTTVSGTSDKMREFYTIQTKNGKTFYMVIDKDGNNETAYFLTEISENDLLNATEDTNSTLPMNSAAVGNANGNIVDSALPNTTDDSEISEGEKDGENGTLDTKEELEEKIENDKKKGGGGIYIVIFLVAVGLVGVAFYKKVLQKKGDADDDEDENEKPDTKDENSKAGNSYEATKQKERKNNKED